jgi:hypothetical protein
MLEDSERLQTALRVLTPFTEFRDPEDADVEALRSYVPPFTCQRPDELACEVISRCSGHGRFTDDIAKKVEGALREV